MQLKFTVESGETFVTLTFTENDTKMLDKQCERLGMTRRDTMRPLGVGTATPVGFWHDDSGNQQLHGVVNRRMNTVGMRMSFSDDINAPLIRMDGGMPTVNLGILRFRPSAPGAPLKLKVASYIYAPDEMLRVIRAIPAAFKALAEIVFEASVTITVNRRME